MENSTKDVNLNFPTFGFIVATRAVLGVGIGLLIADRFPEPQRRLVGTMLVGVGLATTIPAAMAVFGLNEETASHLARAGV